MTSRGESVSDNLASSIDAELEAIRRTPCPRRVRQRTTEEPMSVLGVAGLIAGIFFLVLPVIGVVVMLNEPLAIFVGDEVVAEVTEKIQYKGKGNRWAYWIHCRLDLPDGRVEFEERASRGQYEAVQIGGPVRVHVLRLGPLWLSTMRLHPFTLPALVLFGGWTLLLIIYMIRGDPTVRLARHGKAGPGKVIGKHTTHPRRGHTRYHLDYEYRTTSGRQFGTEIVAEEIYHKTAEGDRMIVLYDFADPRRSAVYDWSVHEIVTNDLPSAKEGAIDGEG